MPDYRNNMYADELLLLDQHKNDLRDLQRSYEVIASILRRNYVGDAEWLCSEMFGAVQHKIDMVEKHFEMWEVLGNVDEEKRSGGDRSHQAEGEETEGSEIQGMG